MGNGQVRRVAIIINGDTELRHLNNVEQSLKALEKEGFETYVASPTAPASPHDYYITSHLDQIRSMLEELKGQLDDDDELVIYTTGHGDNEDVGRLCLIDGCESETVLPLLDQLKFGRRVVVMDQCFGGNFGKMFLDDPKTLFVSAGGKDESVCCNEIAPLFWAETIPDLNGDGQISWQERYANVFTTPPTRSFPQFIPSPGYTTQGKPPFENHVVEVGDTAALEGQLVRFEAGQYAFIYFALPDEQCKPCKEYGPKYKALAEQAGGQHLFLKTFNEDIFAKYGVNGAPTVVIIDARGVQYSIDTERLPYLLEELSHIGLNPDQKLDLLFKRLKEPSPDEKIQMANAWQYAKTIRELPPEKKAERLEALRQLYNDPREEVRFAAEFAMAYSGESFGEDVMNAMVDESLRRLSESAADEKIRVLYNLASLLDSGAIHPYRHHFARITRVLRSLFNHPNENVAITAMGIYANSMRSLPIMSVEDFGVIGDLPKRDEATLRFHYAEFRQGVDALKLFLKHPIRRIRCYATEALGKIIFGLPPGEQRQNYSLLIPLFEDPDPGVRTFAMEAYEITQSPNRAIGHFDPQGLEKARQLLYHPDPMIRITTAKGIEGWRHLFERKERIAFGSIFVKLAGEDPESDVRAAAMETAAFFLDNVSKEEQVKFFGFVKEALQSGDLGLTLAALGTTYCFHARPASELDQIAKIIRGLNLGSEPWIAEKIILGYAGVARYVSPPEAAEADTWLRPFLTSDDTEIFGAATYIYEWFVKKLGDSAMSPICETLWTIIKRQKRDKRDRALFVLGIMGERIPPEWAVKFAPEIRRLYETKNANSFYCLKAYEAMSSHLSYDEIRKMTDTPYRDDSDQEEVQLRLKIWWKYFIRGVSEPPISVPFY